MKPEPTDIDLVDALYDERPPSERAALLARIEATAEDARALDSYRAVLDLVRAYDEEILPTAQARAALLAQAKRAQTPWWARLLGSNLASPAARPALAAALLVVLLVGVGLFFALRSGAGPTARSGQGAARRGAETHSVTAARDETVLAEAPAASRGEDTGISARNGLTGKATDKETALATAQPIRRETEKDALRGGDTPLAASPRAGVDSLSGNTRSPGRKGDAFTIAQDGSAGRGKGRQRDVRGLVGTGSTSDRRARRRRSGAAGFYGVRSPAPPRARPSAASQALPNAAAPAARHLERRGGGGTAQHQRFAASGEIAGRAERGPGPKGKQAPAAPALYRTAQDALARGKVAQACSLFAALVRQHRSYPRRADALLGWARCELARGAYGRARAVVAQLMREYPTWRKSGQALLAQVQRRQRRSRAQRKARAAKRSRARPARRPASQQSAN